MTSRREKRNCRVCREFSGQRFSVLPADPITEHTLTMHRNFTLDPQDRTRARHWFFTENNPEGDLVALFEFYVADGLIDYATFQLEVGEDGTEHHQGYVNFKKQTLFSTVKKILPRAHWQLCLDPIAARAYCQKSDSRLDGPYEIGRWNPPEEKQRVWKAIAQDITEGKRDYELFQKYPMQVITQFKGINNARNIVSAPRTFKTKVILVYGLPGIGKSRFILEQFPNAFWKSPDSAWFDGYSGQDDVVLDDFYGSLQLSTFLRLTDRYPLLCQTKGGHVNFQAKRIIISSNSLPTSWYSKAIEKTPWLSRAILRRFDGLIVANSGPSDLWTYYYGQEAQRQLENPITLATRVGLDGTSLNDWSLDENPNLYD